MENTTEVKTELTYPEFTKQVFARIMSIVENSNCLKYKIMGYKYLDVRLVLYFQDCNQVFDFSKDPYEIEETQFFTANKTHEDNMNELGKWKDETERDVPEIEEPTE